MERRAGDEEIEARLQSFLASLGPHLQAVPGLREMVEDLVLQAAQSERDLHTSRTPEEQEQVDMLERRVGKLDQALAAMKRSLNEVILSRPSIRGWLRSTARSRGSPRTTRARKPRRTCCR